MRILCVIDQFGSGGAQRQMANLACGLKQHGHEVEFFIYFPQYFFFRKQIEECGIPVHEFHKGRGFSLGLIKRLVALIRNKRFEIVISFLSNPNIYAELSCIFSTSAKLVVSERNSHLNDRSHVRATVMRNLHRLSDFVVTNSVAHTDWLLQEFSWLKGKCTTIYNGADLEGYPGKPNLPSRPRDLRLIAVGRVVAQKNLINFMKGLHIFHAAHGWVPQVSWVGRREESTSASREYCQKVDDLLDSMPSVKQRWQWLGERTDVPELLDGHHALILSSFYEGLPNVICEALAAGRPVLASDVCDNSILVPDGERGFLFDPSKPETIAEAIMKLSVMDQEGWIRMSKIARRYAETSLSIEHLVSSYEKLFKELAGQNS